MNKSKPHKVPLSVRELAKEVARLRARVDALEEAQELDAAIRRAADKPLIPRQETKKDFGLT